jgi:YD repeat-containing protein
MAITTFGGEPVPAPAKRHTGRNRRVSALARILGLAAGALVCICGLPRMVGEVRAGGGGIGSTPSVSYVYDADGRLIAAVDASNDCVVYQYDPVGNLLAISGGNPGVAMVPNAGNVGQQVTIYGCGFSATAADDTVLFSGANGGVDATVTAASTTRLVVTVPAGAESGTVNVTVTTSSGSNTGTSSIPFTVQ